MKTYIFVQKNGSAVITLSADSREDADKELAEIVKSPNEFRLEETEDEDEDE